MPDISDIQSTGYCIHMNDIVSGTGCPCESGLPFSGCCGVVNRTAVSADIAAVVSANGIIEKYELTPQIQSAINLIHGNPDLFPARINFFEGKAWFVKMSPRWYRESVFLDPARIKGTFVIESDLNWLHDVCKRIAWQPSSYIFHTAFCGSTLMSQALDALFDCLPLREPEVLGNVLVYERPPAETDNTNAWLNCVLHLLSRRYETDQAVVVKANDYANPLMLALAKSEHHVPILFMYTPLSEFLAGCFKAKNRREWIAQRYKSVVSAAQQWLNLPSDLPIDDDAHGKMAAVYWCYNIALYLAASRQMVTQVRSLDFNHMLANPLKAVQAAGALFGLDARNGVDIDGEIGRLFGVYSKNSKFTYSPEQRGKDIEVLLKQNPAELDEAVQLAHQLLGNSYPSNGLPGGLLDS